MPEPRQLQDYAHPLGHLGHYGGLPIFIDDQLMSTPAHDWSRCRSPSRAQRRAKRGFPQHDRWIRVPRTDVLRLGNKFIMHSTTRARLEAISYAQ